jgi:DNA-binding transcriptional LysR family regulator
MNYTLHQLQIFTEVVRQKSVTKAAEAMHMTQPALSIQLKNFQRQFEFPLVEIIGKKLYITDFGLTIAEIAQNILQEADAIKYKTKEYSGLIAGKLRISSASTGKYVMPYFLTDFLKDHPGIDLTMDVSNKTKVIKSLADNAIDFALVSVLPTQVEVEEELLMQNQLFLVGNTTEFDPNRPLIYREEGSATRVAMDHYFSKRLDRKGLKLTSNEAVKQAVIAGLGYSILPVIGIKNELSQGQLHIIDSPGLPITTNWRLIWLKNKKLSSVAQAYLTDVRLNKKRIIEQYFSKHHE